MGRENIEPQEGRLGCENDSAKSAPNSCWSTLQTMTRILAQATVDQLRSGPVPLWEVSVHGEPPHDHRRVYTLERKTDDLAAQEGLRLFAEEIECLNGAAAGSA